MVDGNLISATGCLNIWLLRSFVKTPPKSSFSSVIIFFYFLRDNSSDPLSGDPDAVEWEKGFIEYAIENVRSHIVKSNQSHSDHKVSCIFSQPPEGKPEGIEIFGLAERSYDDEINFVVRQFNPQMQ